MKHIILYPANVANGFRLIIFMFMVYNMRTSPFVALSSSIVSGLIDEFDGDIARHFKQTTKFGAFIDRAIDRSTSTVMCCFLCSLYCKYWSLFFLYITVELTGDAVNLLHMHYSSMLNLLDLYSIQDNHKILGEIKHDIYGFVGLKLPVHANMTTRAVMESQPSFNISKIINPLIWYTSDLFFLFMYWGGLVIIRYNQQKATTRSPISLKNLLHDEDGPKDQQFTMQFDQDIDLNNNNFSVVRKTGPLEIFLNSTSLYATSSVSNEKSICSRLYHELGNAFGLIMFVFGELGGFIEMNMNAKIGSLLAVRISRLKTIFSFFGLICLLGMITKFSINFHFLLNKIHELIQVDMRLTNLR
jgi:phosphatidylserine synthase